MSNCYSGWLKYLDMPQTVIANEVKQSQEIATSLPAYRQAGAPRNDYFSWLFTIDSGVLSLFDIWILKFDIY